MQLLLELHQLLPYFACEYKNMYAIKTVCCRTSFSSNAGFCEQQNKVAAVITASYAEKPLSQRSHFRTQFHWIKLYIRKLLNYQILYQSNY